MEIMGKLNSIYGVNESNNNNNNSFRGNNCKKRDLCNGIPTWILTIIKIQIGIKGYRHLHIKHRTREGSSYFYPIYIYQKSSKSYQSRRTRRS